MHDIKAAIRVGLSVGLPLAAVYLAGRLDLAVFGAFGGLTSLYGHSESALQRIETQIMAALALIVTIAAAAAFAAYAPDHGGAPWLLAMLLAAAVLGPGSLGAVLGWVPRGEIFFVLTLMVIAGLPMDWAKVPLAIAVGAASAALSVILAILFGGGARNARAALSQIRMRTRAGAIALDVSRHKIAIVVSAAAVLAGWLIADMTGIGHP
ncbi:MAG TPA: hypothetical protein VEA17_18170, partial [Bordetella sp.]|nr:hypothetical protein [Bordetella sp.]